MNTYTWKITNIQCRPMMDGKRDVVSFVSWELIATSDQLKQVQGESSMINIPYTAKTSGQTLINYQPSDNFMPYDELTEQQIVQWTIDSIGDQVVAEMKKQLDGDILSDIEYPVVPKPLPWK